MRRSEWTPSQWDCALGGQRVEDRVQ
jgi:hypothetical protein